MVALEAPIELHGEWNEGPEEAIPAVQRAEEECRSSGSCASDYSLVELPSELCVPWNEDHGVPDAGACT